MSPRRTLRERCDRSSFLRWFFFAAAIFLVFGASGDSLGSGPATATGVQVTRNVPFVRESIDEIRTLTLSRPQAAPENRAIPFRRIQRRAGAAGEAGSPPAGTLLAAPVFGASPAPSAPVAGSSFAGIGNSPQSGDVVPPDTMGAAGPDHLVTLLNSDFGVLDKSTGAILQRVSLQSFWGSLGTAAGEPANIPFDPKVLYDTSSGRFLAVTLGGTSAPDSWILIAVSSSPDPTGAWNKWAIDADKDNNVQQFNNSADFPGLGVDAFNVYVTANMFSASSSQYSKVWVIPKAQLLAGTNPITWFEFRAPPGSDFTMQPAHTFGTSPAEYFLYEGAVNHLAMAWIDNASGTPVWHAPLSVPVAPYASTGSLEGAPQIGNTNPIDTADTRLLNAVYRNGSLWGTHTVPGAASLKTEVAWYRIDTGAGAVLAQGRISDPARWYYYPSIGVNRDNVAAIGFSGSSSTEYVGGYYTVVQPASGIADVVGLLKDGEAPYFKTLGGSSNRWGDFSATVVDPADNVTFWTVQEYALAPDPVSGVSRWGTWWGKFRAIDVLAPTGLTVTADNTLRVTLHWTDLATNETGYVVERKVGENGSFVVLTSPPLPANSVAYTDTAGLVAGTTYFYRVGAVGTNGTAYSGEAAVTTPGTPPASGGGGGGGGGCLSIQPSGGTDPFGASLFSVGILLLPAIALGLRRIFRPKEGAVPIRHPLC